MVKNIVDQNTSLLSVLLQHKINDSLILNIWNEGHINFIVSIRSFNLCTVQNKPNRCVIRRHKLHETLSTNVHTHYDFLNSIFGQLLTLFGRLLRINLLQHDHIGQAERSLDHQWRTFSLYCIIYRKKYIEKLLIFHIIDVYC